MGTLRATRIRKLLLSLVVFNAHLAIASAPPTVVQVLKQLGIGLDRVSLIRALRDPRPYARVLAAAELAEQHDKLAIPDIEAAMTDQENIENEFNFAESLAGLGDDLGVRRLQQICADRTADETLRIRAAGDLASFVEDYSCAPQILDLLDSAEPYTEFNTLSYLSQVPASEKDHASFGPVLLGKALHDPDERNRRLAQKALMTLGDEQSKMAWAAASAGK